MLNDSTCFGSSLLSRLDRDVFSQPNVRTMVLLEGINDLSGDHLHPNDGGYQAMADAAFAVPGRQIGR